jgi:hypothetical protein
MGCRTSSKPEKMKIICISQVYWPDTVSVAQHLSDLLEALSVHGHTVSVYTSRHNYEHPELVYPSCENHKNVKIYRLFNSGFGKRTIVGRLFDFLSFNASLLLKLIFLKPTECDLMIGSTSPPLVSYIGVKIAKSKKIRFVYWIMDLHPELSIEAGYIKPNSAAAKITQKWGDYIFQHSDKIIALDKYMRQHIYNRLRNVRPDIDVIPVWPVMEKVYEGNREDNPFRKEHGFGDKIVVMYSGNHAGLHPLTTLLDAAVYLKDDSRFLFVHIGGGVRLSEVQDYKKQYALHNITILPFQPREKIHLSLGAADIQVVSLGNNIVGYSHPNKIYGSMFIGKPILYIGPVESHITDILNQCPGNISVRHGDSQLLINQLIMFADLSIYDRMLIGKQNRLYAEHHFQPEMLINQMIKSIELKEK